MKRISNIITEENVTLELCQEAIREAAKGKMRRRSVRTTMSHFYERAEEIRDMILNDTFVPSPYGYKEKMEYGKLRKLCVPRFYPDQVIHHVMIMLIEDKIMKRIDPYAIASVKGRGIHYGLNHIENWVSKEEHCRRDSKYCFKGDIRHCFESIKPDVALTAYSSFIKDKKYLNIMKKILYCSDSLPLGNYISAYTLNLLLKPMDVRIRDLECAKHYLRYMDDFIVLGANKRKMKVIRDVVIEELSKLNLKLKDNYQLFKVDNRGIDIVGYRIFRNRVLLRKRNMKRLFRKAKKMHDNKIYSVKDCMSFISMLAQVKYCENKYIYKVLGDLVNIPLAKHIIGEYARKRDKGVAYESDVILR